MIAEGESVRSPRLKARLVVHRPAFAICGAIEEKRMPLEEGCTFMYCCSGRIDHIFAYVVMIPHWLVTAHYPPIDRFHNYYQHKRSFIVLNIHFAAAAMPSFNSHFKAWRFVMPIPNGFDFSNVTLLAQLSTQIIIGGEVYACLPGGTRDACVSQIVDSFDPVRNTTITILSPGRSFFTSDDPVLGTISIFNDPRVTIPGKIFYSHDDAGNVTAPALSSFYHAMVFHRIPPAGGGPEQWLYSGAIWEVHAALNSFPPVGRQYHHATSDVPLFDLLTGQQSGIRKGISTIALGQIATVEQRDAMRARYDAEIALFNALPGKMSPPSIAAYI